MKPSKKKSSQAKKSVNNGISSTPRIDNYFKVAAKELNLDVEETIISEANDEGDLKAIYIEALKKKLQDLDGEEEAVDDTVIEDLEQEEGAVGGTEKTGHEKEAVGNTVHDICQNVNEPLKCLDCVEWKTKFDELQKFCLKLTLRNAEMDLKYDALLKTKTVANQIPKHDAAVASSSNDFFTPRELRYLECMKLDKKADSTFLHHCLQYTYKDNLHVLSQRTLKGKAEVLHISEDGKVERVVEGKKPLTPPKVHQMRSLFIERIDKCGVGAVDYSDRIEDTYFNRLIAAAVYNIAKKHSD